MSASSLALKRLLSNVETLQKQIGKEKSRWKDQQSGFPLAGSSLSEADCERAHERHQSVIDRLHDKLRSKGYELAELYKADPSGVYSWLKENLKKIPTDHRVRDFVLEGFLSGINIYFDPLHPTTGIPDNFYSVWVYASSHFDDYIKHAPHFRRVPLSCYQQLDDVALPMYKAKFGSGSMHTKNTNVETDKPRHHACLDKQQEETSEDVATRKILAMQTLLTNALYADPQKYCNRASFYKCQYKENGKSVNVYVDHTMALIAAYRPGFPMGECRWSKQDKVILSKKPEAFLTWAEEAVSKRSQANASSASTSSFWHCKRDAMNPVRRLYEKMYQASTTDPQSRQASVPD